jgi:hypothetical protein
MPDPAAMMGGDQAGATTAPPDGGVPSGQGGGPDQASNNLPPSGAPGAQPVEPHGMVMLGRSFVAEAVRFLFMAIKALPPGEEFDMAHKVYSQLSRHFKIGPDQAKSGQSQAAQPQMPGAPQPGQGAPPRGPAPSPMGGAGMPQLPGMDQMQ